MERGDKMLYCSHCHKGLHDGTIFCDYCGTEVTSAPSDSPQGAGRKEGQRIGFSRASEPSRQPSQSPGAAVQTIQPPVPASELNQQTPPSLSAVHARAPRPPEAGALPSPNRAKPSTPVAREPGSVAAPVILLQLGRDVFELSGQNTYLVGRRDIQAQLFPDVDLHAWDGANAGVSRRHLIIRVTGNVVSIEDLESRNSTIVNGYRLFSHQQYPLVDGDEIRLGDITLLATITIGG
jgi:pSer/pThr/pTyr-binding forkhead associated (FHA) protein